MNREEFIYYEFMRTVVSDGYISVDESGLILIIEDRLGLTDDQMDEIMGLIEEGKEPDPEDKERLLNDRSNHLYELRVYKEALKEAVKDETIEKDEFGLLHTLTVVMGVSEEERKQIYSEIKEELKKEMEEKAHPGLFRRIADIFGPENE